MIKTVLAATAAAFAVSFFASITHAGPIESACNRSDRHEANRALCNCIQQAADVTLTGTDQRRAAKFFADPDEAQAVFLSKTDRDDMFWERYRNFGTTAEAYCAG